MWKQAKGPHQSLKFVMVPKVATGQGHICNCFVKIRKSSPSVWEHIFSLCIIPSFILALCQEFINHVLVVSHYILLLVFYRRGIKRGFFRNEEITEQFPNMTNGPVLEVCPKVDTFRHKRSVPQCVGSGFKGCCSKWAGIGF